MVKTIVINLFCCCYIYLTIIFLSFLWIISKAITQSHCIIPDDVKLDENLLFIRGGGSANKFSENEFMVLSLKN